jgi:hypothetical protein
VKGIYKAAGIGYKRICVFTGPLEDWKKGDPAVLIFPLLSDLIDLSLSANTKKREEKRTAHQDGCPLSHLIIICKKKKILSQFLCVSCRYLNVLNFTMTFDILSFF